MKTITRREIAAVLFIVGVAAERLATELVQIYKKDKEKEKRGKNAITFYTIQFAMEIYKIEELFRCYKTRQHDSYL